MGLITINLLLDFTVLPSTFTFPGHLITSFTFKYFYWLDLTFHNAVKLLRPVHGLVQLHSLYNSKCIFSTSLFFPFALQS